MEMGLGMYTVSAHNRSAKLQDLK